MTTSPDPTPEDRFDDGMPTRASLLVRLKDWEDQEGWREFFDTYWRLIFNVARRSGLSESEAQDVVQETMLGVAKKMPAFTYDPAKGSFKAWLRLNVRSRIVEHWRRKAAADARHGTLGPSESGTGTDVFQRVADPAEPDLEQVWQKEWENNLLQAALARTKSRVSARQFLIFDLVELKETPVPKITRTLGVNVAQVYLARHRVGKVLRAELKALRDRVGE